MLTHSELLEIVHYNQLTGDFTWLKPPQNTKIKKGDKLTNLTSHKKPYYRVKIKQKTYRLHILAWFYVTEEWPTEDIDHKNGNRLDNTWGNLRLATDSENGYNAKLPSNNTSGIKGISKVTINSNTYWMAQITANRKNYTKYFKEHEFEEASIWIHTNRRMLHGEFARYF